MAFQPEAKQITVSRKSWHYRVYRYMHHPLPNWMSRMIEEPERRDVQPKAICGYFWLIVLSPVILLGTWIVIAAVTAIFGPLALVIMGISWMKDNYDTRVLERGPTKITFAASYVKARKARICPRVVLR